MLGVSVVSFLTSYFNNKSKVTVMLNVLMVNILTSYFNNKNPELGSYGVFMLIVTV
jgi:hypothetical protein